MSETLFTYDIYLYRWLLSGHPFYIGSTTNLLARDRSHSRYASVEADGVIQRFGRDRFTLEILETITGTDSRDARRIAHIKENEYIVKFNTLEKQGGGNLALNPVSQGERKEVHISTALSIREFHEFNIVCERLGKNKSQTIRDLVCQFIKDNQ